MKGISDTEKKNGVEIDKKELDDIFSSSDEEEDGGGFGHFDNDDYINKVKQGKDDSDSENDDNKDEGFGNFDDDDDNKTKNEPALPETTIAATKGAEETAAADEWGDFGAFGGNENDAAGNEEEDIDDGEGFGDFGDFDEGPP